MRKPGALRIAIVDDDASVCRALKRLVRSLGMEAETFASGREMLELMRVMPTFKPDCVVLDVQMPDIGGLELQRRLAPSGLPVIFITAHDDVGVRESALAAGAVAFMRKPFQDEILIRTLRAAVAGNASHDGTDEM
jgi:FixJ family two-component response regulator